MFTLQQGDRWICPRRACGAEFVVLAPSELQGGRNPRCSCGSEMRRHYEAPTVQKLPYDEAEKVLHDPAISEELRLSRQKRSKS